MSHIDERYRVMLAALAEVLGDLLRTDMRVSYVVVLVQHESETHHKVGVASDLDREDTQKLFAALAVTTPGTVYVPRTPRVN